MLADGRGGGALPRNAAFADRRLEGKRSRRVEALCGAHAGKGTPCDFVSVHAYNKAEVMAAKLIRAKEMALEIDPEYYKGLWVNSHEACPDWLPPPDEAAADSYLGNGYFPTWCLDVVDRQLARAAGDRRFAFGETILTVWPPPGNFAGINAVSRVFHVDDNGDGKGDRTVTLPMPIFHVLGLLADLGANYWVLPARSEGGHRVGGFASRDDRGVVRAVLYTHQAEDTQSRSDAAFDITLKLGGVADDGAVRVSQWHFDREHNSPFKVARAFRERAAIGERSSPARVAALIRGLESGDRVAQRKALDSVPKLGAAGRQAIAPAILKLAGQETDQVVRDLAKETLRAAFAPMAYSRAEVEEIAKLCECHSTGTGVRAREADGGVRVETRLAGNGCVFLRIEPENGRAGVDERGRAVEPISSSLEDVRASAEH